MSDTSSKGRETKPVRVRRDFFRLYRIWRGGGQAFFSILVARFGCRGAPSGCLADELNGKPAGESLPKSLFVSDGRRSGVSPTFIPLRSEIIMSDWQDLYDAINATSVQPGQTVVLEPKTYSISGPRITIPKGMTIDFNGAVISLEDGYVDKGFAVNVGVVGDKVVFKNGVIRGSGLPSANAGPVLTCLSPVSLGLMQIDSMIFENLTFGVNFNVSTGNFIRNAVLSNCVFRNIVIDPAAVPAGDPNRGKGAAFSFQGASSTTAGFSYYNTFIGCQRHSLYVEHGGPFLSVGDQFFDNAETQADNITFAIPAVALSRGSDMQIIGASFHNCRDGIAVTSNQPGELFSNVQISNCTFRGTKKRDIYLNSGNVESTGIFRNLSVTGTRHFNTSASARQITVNAFDHMLLRDVWLEIDQSSSQDIPFGIYINSVGRCQDLTIDGIWARYRNNTDMVRTIALSSNVTSNSPNGPNGFNPRVVIRNIDSWAASLHGDPAVQVAVPVHPLPGAGGGYSNPNLKYYPLPM